MQIRKGNKATPKGPRESSGATLLSQLESEGGHRSTKSRALHPSKRRTPRRKHLQERLSHHARDKESAIRRLYQLCHVGPFSFTQDTLPGSNVNTRICLHMQCSNTSSQKQEWHIPKRDRHIKRYTKKALAHRRDTTCPARSPGRKRRLSQSENRDGPKPNSPNQSPRRLPQEARH